MAEFLRIKGWGKYQHYKDRNPPWIKLHRELLTSLTWALADDASRVLAIACMLLAAATDNKIPFDAGYVKRVAYLNNDPDFTQLLKLEFLEVVDDKGNVVITSITPLADASKMQSHARPEAEAEAEAEQRERQKKPSSRSASTDLVFPKAYEQYPRHIGKRAAATSWTNAVNRAWGSDESLDREQAQEMIYQRVMTYAAVCERTHKEKKYIPHMATWLNQDRFMDDPSEWAVTGETSNGNGTRPTSKTADREQRIIDRAIKYQTVAAGATDSAGASEMAVPGNGRSGVSGLEAEPEILPPRKYSGGIRPNREGAAKD